MPFAQDASDVVIVNHHGAADVLGALASLEWPRCGVVHIVDNSVDAQQADALRAGTAANAQVRLTISALNLGFGRACNLAFAQSHTASVLLLNPDARLRPGAMCRLRQTLAEDARLGAVAPRIDWTAEGHLVMPNLTSQTPAARIVQALVSRWAAWWPAGLDRRGRHHALRTMRAMGVMQSGGGGEAAAVPRARFVGRRVAASAAGRA